MAIEKTSEFPNLACNEVEFKTTPPTTAALLGECTAYLNALRGQKAFVVEKDLGEYGVRPYGLYDNPEGSSRFVTERSELPEMRPEDLIARVSIAAKFGKFTEAERKSAKHRGVEKLRGVFAHQAEIALRQNGKTPTDSEDAFVLDYMLRGAMKNFDPKKSLAMNATQFEFDREQTQIMKNQTKNKYQATSKKPGALEPY